MCANTHQRKSDSDVTRKKRQPFELATLACWLRQPPYAAVAQADSPDKQPALYLLMAINPAA